MGDSQRSSSSASAATIDWIGAFQLPEFLSDLQAANVAVTTSNPVPKQLEKLGDSIASQPSTSAMSAAGDLPTAQGTSHAPSFVNTVNGNVPEPSCPLSPSQQSVNELNPTSVTSLAPSFPAPNVGLGLQKAFSLGADCPPIPPKLVTKILFYKFVDLTELLPENLDDPVSDTTSFTIESNRTIQSEVSHAYAAAGSLNRTKIYRGIHSNQQYQLVSRQS